MKQLSTVFGFTFRDAARKKSFIISTAVFLIVVLALCVGLKFFADSSGDDSSQQGENIISDSGVCYYLDESGVIPGGMQALGAVFGETEFKAAAASELDSVKQQMKDDGDISAVIVTTSNGLPQIEIITRDFMSGISPQVVSEVLGKTFSASVLAQSGIDPSAASLALAEPSVTLTYAGERDTVSYILGIVITMLMFFAIYFYGYGVSMSIATEKTSRVMETLVVSAKPSVILLGKCLAMGTLGLVQLGSVLLFGGVLWKALIPDGITVMGMPLSLSGVNSSMLIVMLIYFILGYALYSVMNAVCGASVSKIEDLNSALMPVMLICMVSFYFGYFTSLFPNQGTVQRIAMYIPFSAPFIVPFRLLNGEATTADIIISVLLMVVAIVVVTALSVKIYSASVLHYGKRLKIKDVISKK